MWVLHYYFDILQWFGIIYNWLLVITTAMHFHVTVKVMGQLQAFREHKSPQGPNKLKLLELPLYHELQQH